MENWIREDKKYVTTKAYNHILGCVENFRCVTVTGGPGVGKTATIRHIALFYAKKGYTIFPVIVPDDVRLYFKPGKRRLFVIDELFGKSSASTNLIDAWEQFNTVIMDAINDGNYMFIVACRLQIYRDDKFKKLTPFRTCECNMVSPKLRLSKTEKIKIAESHIENFEILKTPIPDFDFFPLLCRMCAKKSRKGIAKFFANPFTVLQEELDIFFDGGNDSRFKLCALALLVLHNNDLEKCMFTSDTFESEQIDAICKIFRLPTGSDATYNILTALRTLDETYVIEENNVYKTKHEMIFYFIVQYFSEKNVNCEKIIACLIKYSDLDLIHERFIFNTNMEQRKDNFMVILPDKYVDSYFDRIVTEWSNGNLWSVLDNEKSKFIAHRKKLIQYLQNLEKSKQIQLAKKNVQTENNESFNPLVWCCYYGYADILKWLASVDVDINQKVYLKGSWFSPLTIACVRDQTEMIKTCLDLGAEVNTINREEITPIYSACTNNNSIHVELLLKYNADINIKGHYEVTPLLLACLKNDIKIVYLLLLHNASSVYCFSDRCSTYEESECLRWLQASCKSFVKKYKNLNTEVTLFEFIQGSSPLHIACFNENDKIVEKILNKNPTINIQKKDGATPLFIACELGNKDIVRLLLNKGADTEIKRKDGASPLSVVTDYEVREMILRNKKETLKVV